MQSFAKDLSRVRARRQSGSVAMLGALWLMIAVICLATIDIGNVFWQKRELQKIADLAALAGASGALNQSSCRTNAENNLRLNGGAVSELVSAEAGRWDKRSTPFFGAASKVSEINACKVEFERNVQYFFIFSASGIERRNVKASAIAKQIPQLAKITVRSTLLNLNTDNSVLAPLLDGLLGTSVAIDAVGWKGLAGADIDLLSYLNLLSSKLNLRVGDYENLLNADVGVGDLLATMIDLLKKQGSTADTQVTVLEKLLTAVNVRPVTVSLSNLLNLGAGLSEAALKTSINTLDFASALVMLSNSKNAVAANIGVNLGLVKADVRLKVIEPPQSAIGNPAVDVIEAKTSQVEVSVATGVNLIPVGSLDVNLSVKVAGGTAKVDAFSCAPNNKYLNVSSSTGLLNVGLGLVVKVLFIPIEASVPLDLSSAKSIEYKNPPPPRLEDPPLWKTIDFNLDIVSSLVAAVLKVPILGPVLSIILLPLTSLLDSIIGAVLNMLGIRLSQVDVAGQLNCGYQAELVF